jgi:endonuclease/exonuclease/phosphatase family metal-dependent hydrolase
VNGVRFCAYNVHGFRAGPAAVAAAVAGERPDIVFVNEARRGRLRRFAAALEMRAVSGLAWFGGIPNAVLVRPPWAVTEHRVLRFARTGRAIPRGAVVARLARREDRLWVAGVHLGLTRVERTAHAAELLEALGRLDPPVVVGGDLNDFADRGPALAITERFVDAFAAGGDGGDGFTYPAIEPRARIDYLFAGEGVRVTRAWVLETAATRAASDHLPLFADVELDPVA